MSPERERDNFCDGTYGGLFSSVNAMRGKTQSQRDDMLSLGYVLMYCLRGSLPWTEYAQKQRSAGEVDEGHGKERMTPDILCEGYPDEFCEYCKHCLSLWYREEPNYKHLEKLLRQVGAHEGYVWDFVFDWTPGASAVASDAPAS
eukprot:1080543-Amphidinium_carterae.1